MLRKLFILWQLFSYFLQSQSCPPGLIEGISTVYCYKLVNEPLSWFAADYTCRQLGGNLVTIDNGFLNALLVGAAQEVFAVNTTFWIGYTNVYYPGQWRWSDGNNANYSNWAPGQPTKDGTLCAGEQTPNRFWYSDVCTVEKSYVCEIPQIPPTTQQPCPTLEPPSQAPLITGQYTGGLGQSNGPTSGPGPTNCAIYQSPCPQTDDNWIYLALFNKCYLYLHSPSYLTWAASRNECINKGGDMVSIATFEENSLVGAMGMRVEINANEGNLPDQRETMWLGLSKDGGVWKWTDGTTANYTIWENGQPDPNYSYVTIGFGQDNDFKWYAQDVGNTISICQAAPLLID